MLEYRQLHGGQSAGVEVLGVRGSVQGRLRGAPVDFGERVLKELYGRQDLGPSPVGTRISEHHRVTSPLSHNLHSSLRSQATYLLLLLFPVAVVMGGNRV